MIRPSSEHCHADQKLIWLIPLSWTVLTYFKIVQITFRYRNVLFKKRPKDAARPDGLTVQTWKLTHPGVLIMLLHYGVWFGSIPTFIGAGFNDDSDDVERSFYSYVNAWGEANYYVVQITHFYVSISLCCLQRVHSSLHR